MADIYSLLSNEYVKSIICKYVTNSREYKEFLIYKYLLVFFKIYEFQNDNLTISYLDKFLYNIRWYISESYLEDIRTLKGKVNLEIFWSRLHPAWYTGIFNNTNWLSFLHNLKIRFVLCSAKVKCCFFYEVYRLAISHEYIEYNFFDKMLLYGVYNRYIPILKVHRDLYKSSPNLGQVYNNIVELYKDSPEKYKDKNGLLDLRYLD